MVLECHGEQVDQENLQFKSEHADCSCQLSDCLGPHLAVGKTAKKPREWGRASANPFSLKTKSRAGCVVRTDVIWDKRKRSCGEGRGAKRQVKLHCQS